MLQIQNIIKLIGFCSVMLSLPVLAGEPTTVPMHDKGAATYYVPVSIKGWGTGDFLVDTGASYMAINQVALNSLKASDQAEYIKQLIGTLADGNQIVVPVYRIASVRIGRSCKLTDVEAAVFPGNTRNILGLSALRRTAPFRFSVDPPKLILSGCNADSRTASLD
ncbi:MAG: retroviral-like aspartic protease family protein [Nitrococcus sp.]|nr:retroviral-like aspartic protease family protein [Nitrococcus sp.]